jgi:hypothetical protein
MDEYTRKQAATAIVQALESQPGIDVLPAQSALPRVLTGIWKRTGFEFKHIGHGRMRDAFEVVSKDNADLSLVLKVGGKQATARDIALTLVYPEDRAKIYAASEYAVVSERVERFTQVFKSDEEYAALIAQRFSGRYIGVAPEDLGMIGDRIVMVGSSTRVVKQDAKNPTSSTRQTRTM